MTELTPATLKYIGATKDFADRVTQEKGLTSDQTEFVRIYTQFIDKVFALDNSPAWNEIGEAIRDLSKMRSDNGYDSYTRETIASIYESLMEAKSRLILYTNEYSAPAAEMEETFGLPVETLAYRPKNS